jgi:hypothetical protein
VVAQRAIVERNASSGNPFKTSRPVTYRQEQADRADRLQNYMVWFQVNIPLVLGCLLMAALMDLRVFKLGLLVASILLLLVASIVLMFSATGVIVFGTRLGILSANAVPVLSVMVWLACVVSAIRRWFPSKRPYEPFDSTADRTAACEMALSGGAWMLNPTTRLLTGQIASESDLNKLISRPSGSTLYGVVLGEAGWVQPVQLVRLHEQDGRVPLARAFEPRILQIAIGPVTEILSAS